MIRSVMWATALGVLMSGIGHAQTPPPPATGAKPEAAAPTEAPPTVKKATKKKGKKHAGHKAAAHQEANADTGDGGGAPTGHKAHHGGAAVSASAANSPFADVPRDHWAYEAVSKAVESGLLQGYSNKFYGSRPMTRYQMAVVVARMLDRLHVLKANGRMFTAQDIANLEALTIEFADELSLLNVKVSTLEEQVAVLRKDVDLVKYDLGPGGPRSSITGVISARSVFTASARPGYGAVQTGTIDPLSAATPALLRYRGDNTGPGAPAGVVAPGNLGNPFNFDSRDFATIAQLSLNLDRQVTKDIEFHMQVDIDAESRDAVRGDAFGVGIANSGVLGNNRTGAVQVPALGGSPTSPLIFGSGRGQTFFAGTPLHVNLAYLEFNSWVGDADAVTGLFPVPFNVENNGPSRTYNWTLTPSVANTFWESLRPVGVELRNGRKEDYWLWNFGVFSNLDGSPSGGTLLSGVQFANIGGPTDPFGHTSVSATGRFPTPRVGVMSDAPRGVDGEIDTTDVGFYARLGGQNRDNLGFGWQIGYIDNGGDIRPGGGSFGSLSDWYAWQGEVDYKWKHWMALAQYFESRTRNLSEPELTIGGGAFDTRNVGRGSPFPNAAAEDTRSSSIMGLLTYAWNKKSSLTLRYEDAHDDTGPALVGANFWTLAFNHRMNERGLVQLEYIAAKSRARSDTGIQNDIDISDDLFQANYRLNF